MALLLILAAASPAVAGPNAFWGFGFDWRYNHGAGGFADSSVKRSRQQETSVRQESARLATEMVGDTKPKVGQQTTAAGWETAEADTLLSVNADAP